MRGVLSGFSPLSLSPALWLSDTGSDASVWSDLSGNSFSPTQANASFRPSIILNAINGRQVRRFDGSDDVLKFATPNNILQNVAGGTLFVVRKFITSPQFGRIVFAAFVNGSNTSARGLLAGGAIANKAYAGGRRLDSDSISVVNSSADISTTNFQIHSAVLNYQNSDLFQYINGSLDGSTTSFQTDGSTSNTQSNGFSIGATLADTLFANVEVGEIIVFNTTLSTTNRQRVERYLGAKWGITVA